MARFGVGGFGTIYVLRFISDHLMGLWVGLSAIIASGLKITMEIVVLLISRSIRGIQMVVKRQFAGYHFAIYQPDGQKLLPLWWVHEWKIETDKVQQLATCLSG